jgi:endonuclease YncB( thermonuclease family)
MSRLGLAAFLSLAVAGGYMIGAQLAPVPYVAYDGDTIIHGHERIRLIGIDAPEMPDSPRRCDRVHCPAGDPFTAKRDLQIMLGLGPVECEGSERDRYGRRLATCYVRFEGRWRNINEALVRAGSVERYRQ